MNARAPRIEIADLRHICQVLLDEAERRFGPSVQSGGLYWLASLRDSYALDGLPPLANELGSVPDDVEELSERLLGDPPHEVFLWHDLQHLIGVLGHLAFLDLPSRG